VAPPLPPLYAFLTFFSARQLLARLLWTGIGVSQIGCTSHLLVRDPTHNIAGVYPNGAYSPQLHAEVLHDVHETMQTWGLPLFNFLSVTENPLAMGQWLPGISADAGHPNTQGHTLMYNAIDISLFANLQCPLI